MTSSGAANIHQTMGAARSAFIKMPRDWSGTLAPGRYVWRRNGWTPIGTAAPLNVSHGTGPMVIKDIEPYKSMITGEMIQGRAHHRAHLRQHGGIEVGNEKLKPRPPAKVDRAELRESIKETAYRLSDPSYREHQANLTRQERAEQARVSREIGHG